MAGMTSKRHHNSRDVSPFAQKQRLKTGVCCFAILLRVCLDTLLYIHAQLARCGLRMMMSVVQQGLSAPGKAFHPQPRV